ncbi:MAG: N-acetylmuramoyl-L-alanine amidase [Cyanobacteria bacterium P01_F01_bin.4]
MAQANLNVQIAQGSGLPTPSSPSPSPNPAPSGDVFYQVVVPGSSEILRARVNSVESGAFRTTANGQAVIQAGRFRERNRAESLQRRLSQAGLAAQIIQGRGAIASNPSPRPVPRGQVLVMIDPGHGGRDPGAVGIGGLQEKELNLWISQRVQQRLSDQGIQARMTRSDDRELDLQPRVDIAERANATIFVSIHANAISLSRPDVNGLETYYYSSGIGLARTIHNRVLRQTDLRDRGVRRARFYVLRNTSMPAVLVETGFVTGREDVVRFRNLSERQQIADAIADGVVDYLRQTAQIQ